MNRPRAAMVYAAGLGTRMGPLTANRPKPLIPVAGKALLDHALDQVVRGGIDRAVVNVHYKAGMIRDHLRSRRDPAIAISDETDLLLETGGGLKKALPLLDADPVLTLNSDAFWKGPGPIEALSQAWRPETMQANLLLYPVARMKNPARNGDFVLESDGSIRRPQPQEPAPYLYTGAQIITIGDFAKCPEKVFSTWTVWDLLLERRTAFGTVYQGIWVDVGRPDAIAEAEALAEMT
jgi:MurNAc alpha-1-phosphate uridylyltransferase